MRELIVEVMTVVAIIAAVLAEFNIEAHPNLGTLVLIVALLWIIGFFYVNWFSIWLRRYSR